MTAFAVITFIFPRENESHATQYGIVCKLQLRLKKKKKIKSCTLNYSCN